MTYTEVMRQTELEAHRDWMKSVGKEEQKLAWEIIYATIDDVIMVFDYCEMVVSVELQEI